MSFTNRIKKQICRMHRESRKKFRACIRIQVSGKNANTCSSLKTINLTIDHKMQWYKIKATTNAART